MLLGDGAAVRSSAVLCDGKGHDRGLMASCEVDLYGALAMLVQWKASLATTPPHFMD